MSLSTLLSRLFGRPRRAAGQEARETGAINVDDTGVRRLLADGRTESVRWDELESVELLGTDDGPLGEDQYWLLRSATGGCAVPGLAAARTDLLDRLQALPGFDNAALIEAMGSTENACFPLWRRRPSGDESAKCPP